MATADELIAALDLAPHPEGGHYVESWRAATTAAARAPGTAIYFLLRAGEHSHWHRIDSTEIWHFYTGAPLALTTCPEGEAVEELILGGAFGAGQRPQRIVAPGVWQSARSLGDFTLVGCTVSPGFEFAGFELAPAGWQPGMAGVSRPGRARGE